jgi:hypothetical protein
MVAITDTMNADEFQALSIEGPAKSGALSGFVGATLCVSALGLWLVPGATYDPAQMMIKLGLSVFLLLGGIMFMMAARQEPHPEVLLDGRRGMMRLIERDERGQVQSTTVVKYDDLSEVDFRDGMLVARDHHGRTVLEMPVETMENLDIVRAALGPAFSRSA